MAEGKGSYGLSWTIKAIIEKQISAETKPLHRHPFPSRLTAQVFELQQRLKEATTRPLLPAPIDAEGYPADAKGLFPRGLVYVVHPALELEVSRLKEALADRERLIEDYEDQQAVRVVITKIRC